MVSGGMSEMVEKVAAELAEQLGCTTCGGELITTPDGLSDAWLDIGRIDLFEVARAVIAAIREPTDAMKRAGENGPTTMSYGDESSTFAYISKDDAESAWQTMIDAALAEPAKTGLPTPA